MRITTYQQPSMCYTCRLPLDDCQCDRDARWHATQARERRQRDSDAHMDNMADGLKAMAAVLDRVEQEKKKPQA